MKTHTSYFIINIICSLMFIIYSHKQGVLLNNNVVVVLMLKNMACFTSVLYSLTYCELLTYV